MKQLTQFFKGLAAVAEQVKTSVDLGWLDNFPQTTTKLDWWLDQFGLTFSQATTDQQKRDRLQTAWRATGSQSPRYLQDTLQGLGFDVYVHEWWVPGSEPAVGVQACATPRNPLTYLDGAGPSVTSEVQCGEALAQCGEPTALCGYTTAVKGYPLVNLIRRSVMEYTVLCGESLALCGEASALCGEFDGIREVRIDYVIPTDPEKWAYFVYIGAETFPDLATVPASRREEFERTLLKYCPAHMWIGALVNYV